MIDYTVLGVTHVLLLLMLLRLLGDPRVDQDEAGDEAVEADIATPDDGEEPVRTRGRRRPAGARANGPRGRKARDA